VRVVSLRRNNGKSDACRTMNPCSRRATPLVLSGIPENLSVAEQKLLQAQ
jgi:hypothetical protein